MKKIRSVRIIDLRGVWFVGYTNRKRLGRYCAAQFDKTVKTREQVVAWIAAQPDLKLEIKQLDESSKTT